MPLYSLDVKSVIVAEAFETAGAANTPAKNRQRRSEVRLREKPAPRMNSAKIGEVIKMTGFLPRVSLIGEPIKGPAASPRL